MSANFLFFWFLGHSPCLGIFNYLNASHFCVRFSVWSVVGFCTLQLIHAIPDKEVEPMYDLLVFVISIINIDNLCCIWYWVHRLNPGPGQNFLLNSVFVREALGIYQLSGQEIDQAAIIRTHSTQRVYTHIVYCTGPLHPIGLGVSDQVLLAFYLTCPDRVGCLFHSLSVHMQTLL